MKSIDLLLIKRNLSVLCDQIVNASEADRVSSRRFLMVSSSLPRR